MLKCALRELENIAERPPAEMRPFIVDLETICAQRQHESALKRIKDLCRPEVANEERVTLRRLSG